MATPTAFLSERSTIVLFWNKDAFEAAGLDPETPPENWQEMAEMAATIREASNGEQWGVMVPSTRYPYWMFQAFAFQNGHRLISEDGTEVYFDDPAAVEALEYWVSLATEHDAMPDGTIESGTLRQNFLEQSTAMMWHTTGNLTAVRNEAGFDFGRRHAAHEHPARAAPPAAATSTSLKMPLKRSSALR